VTSLLRVSACSRVFVGSGWPCVFFIYMLCSVVFVCTLALKEVVLVVCAALRVELKYTKIMRTGKLIIFTIPHNMTLEYRIYRCIFKPCKLI
jgi:hypothetical protein